MRLSFRTKLLGSIALDLALMIALGVFALNGFSNVFQKGTLTFYLNQILSSSVIVGVFTFFVAVN